MQEFGAFQYIAVGLSVLSRAAGDCTHDLAEFELLEDLRVLRESDPSLLVAGDFLAVVVGEGVDLLDVVLQSGDVFALVLLQPLLEGCGVDGHDGAAGQGVGSLQFVALRVEYDGHDAGLAGHALGGPGEVGFLDGHGAALESTSEHLENS